MKLIALNKNTEKYGYPQEMEYDKATFNGHQLGIAICVQNNNTKEIEANYLSEKLGDEQTRDFLLGELLHESKAVFITENIAQFDEEGRLVPKTIYYMPYYVAEHSRFKPTVINDCISGGYNTSYDAEIEFIFVENGLCRYLTVPFYSFSIPIFEIANNFFDCKDEDDLETLGLTLDMLGIKWQEETEYENEGYVLDFYDEAGQRFDIYIGRFSRLRHLLVSMRIISIKCHINKEE